MTREETSQVLAVLKASYPDFYRNMTQREAYAMLDVWASVFGQIPLDVVRCALLDLVKTHTGFPPRPADVWGKVQEIVSAVTGEPTDEQYWHIFRKAVTNSSYGAEEEFAKLPPVLQHFAHSPSTLRDLARNQDEKTLDTVVKGQFLKQLPAMKERKRFDDTLPEAVRQMVLSTYKPMEVSGELTEGEFNDKRNSVLDSLESLSGGM